MNQGSRNHLHELPLERIETTLANPGCVIFTFIAIFLIISCGGIIIFWLAYRHGLNMGLAALRVLQPPREEPLPTRFMINNSYFIPNHQYNLSTAFAFSAIYLLESYYRFNGIINKYLKSNQYLLLSQDILADTLNYLCKNEYKNTSFCFKREFPDDIMTFSPFFGNQKVYPSEFNLSLLDFDRDDDFDEQIEETNPLKFSVSDVQIFSGVSTTKRSLLISDQPHIMTMPAPMARYWFTCDENDLFEACQQKLFRCEYNRSKFCYYSDFLIEGDFLNLKSHQIIAGPSQSLVLIGYNDNFIPHQTNINTHIGGFIIKNGHGAIGHSFRYLMGEITNQEENKICSDPKNVFYWIPTTLQCAKENKNNISQCNNGFHILSGQKVLWGTTELICINSKYCDKGEKYALLSEDDNSMKVSIGYLSTGTQYGKVIKLNNSEVYKIKKLPFQFLYLAFLPSFYGEINNELCGHLFYSYESINQISSRISTTTENWRVINANIKWQKRSYPSTYKKYNYTYINNSLRNISSYYQNILIDNEL